MKITQQLIVVTPLAFLLLPAAAFSQDSSAPQRGYVEYGFRGITGTVDGRTKLGDVPFSNGFRPDILTSGVNTYTDYRNSFYIPRSNVYIDNYLRFGYKDFQTSVMNPYAYVGPAIDPGGTTGLQRMLFLGADTPGYRAHVLSVTLQYHF
jgi:hypothetical protein